MRLRQLVGHVAPEPVNAYRMEKPIAAALVSNLYAESRWTCLKA